MDASDAIAAFARLHRVRVVVHDVAGRFPGRIAPGWLRHEHALCRAAKGAGHERACIRFDQGLVHDACSRHPDGFAKSCHAGLVELVVPWVEGGELRWLLFAGPWQDGDAAVALRAPRAALRLTPAPPLPREWPDLLEALRCLAARLATLAPPALPAPTTRREAVERFLRLRHGEDVGLPDLADELGLSPSRTSHAVVALFASTFARLLARTRLDTAELLLRSTDLPVSAVASRAGYGDLSHFHAVFRRAHRTSPAAWRRASLSA